jgi:hypothetical protein
MTTGPVSLKTLAVAASVMVVGTAPQSNVMTPPLATAAMNASEVQLAGVPVPITVRGLAMLSAWASAGTAHLPAGFPAGGSVSGPVVGPPLVAPLVPPDVPAPPDVPGSPLLAPPDVLGVFESLEHACTAPAPMSVAMSDA